MIKLSLEIRNLGRDATGAPRIPLYDEPILNNEEDHQFLSRKRNEVKQEESIRKVVEVVKSSCSYYKRKSSNFLGHYLKRGQYEHTYPKPSSYRQEGRVPDHDQSRGDHGQKGRKHKSLRN